MSVASGTFYSNTTGYAAGAPRANGTGTVILLLAVKESAPIMQVKAELKGEQFASSFGYELASADVNGDK
jgi:integrin alpha 7